MNIFICVCTFNRTRMLNQNIGSLINSELPNNYKLNIIIIDNKINNENRAIVSKYCKKNKKKYSIIYLPEYKKGIVYARNCFLKYIYKKFSNNDYLGFVDDDCIVDKFWIKNSLKVLKEKKINIVTGPQQFIKIKSNSINKIIHLISKNYKTSRFVDWAATNNVIFKMNILKRKKLFFDTKLNKIGGSDQLFFLTLKKYGNKIFWSKSMKVYESLITKKINLKWFFKRNLRYGYSGSFMDCKIHGNFIGFCINLLKITFYFSKVFFSIFKKNLHLEILQNIAKILGRILYYFPYKINKYI